MEEGIFSDTKGVMYELVNPFKKHFYLINIITKEIFQKNSLYWYNLVVFIALKFAPRIY